MLAAAAALKRTLSAVAIFRRQYFGAGPIRMKLLDGGDTLAHNPPILSTRTPGMYVAKAAVESVGANWK
jgi:hypothetical protein